MTVVKWPAVMGFDQVAFGRIFEKIERQASPGAPMVTAYTNGEVTLRSRRAKIGYHEAANMDGYQGVEPGDFVVHGLDILRGSVGISDSSGAITKVCSICRPTKPIDLRFVAHAIRTQARSGFIRAMARGIREGGADFRRWGTLAELPIPFPPLSEQQSIADYLDRETRRIDELIAEQRGLIETLRERRRAVTMRAVTLGIDGEAVGDLGDRTIGDVPRSWEVRPLKAWMESLDGQRVPLSATERAERTGAYAYYGASGVIDHVDDYIFDEPLVLVSEDGANLLMRSTPISFVASGKYWVNNHAHVYRATDGETRFWAERIEAVDVAPYVTGSAQPKLTAGALGRIRLSAPVKVDERRRIAEYIDDQTSRIDALIAESEDLIALSQERRAALITAAVTGQVDVRTTA